MDTCYVCGTDRDPHLMMICDLCDYMVAHTYCCGFGNDFPEDWLCQDCEALDLEDSSFSNDSYNDEESEEESEVYEARIPENNSRRVYDTR